MMLIEKNAPTSDLEWLVASCPSLEEARLYSPPMTPEQARAYAPLSNAARVRKMVGL